MLSLKAAQSDTQSLHDSSVRQSMPAPRSPPRAKPKLSSRGHLRQLLESSTAAASRDLPPPSTLTQLPSSQMGTTPLPPHPLLSQGDEQMRHWMFAKMTEDRRLLEQERTRQETLKLEQRKIEQSMLADSLRAGLPPQMIPLIFAGISRDGKSQSALELAQQHLSQQPAPPRSDPPTTLPLPSVSQPQFQPPPSELQRDLHGMPPHQYAVQSTQIGVERSLPQPPSARSSSGMPGLAPALSTRTSDPGTPYVPGWNAMGTSAYAPATRFGTAQNGGVPTRPPVPPQPTSDEQNARPQRPTTPISVYHWLEPVNAQSYPHCEYQVSPNRKRKSQSAHRQAPAPSLRYVDSAAQSPWPAGQPHSPNGRQRSDGPGSRGSRPTHGHTSEQTRKPTSVQAVSDAMRPDDASDPAKESETSGRNNVGIEETGPKTSDREMQASSPKRR